MTATSEPGQSSGRARSIEAAVCHSFGSPLVIEQLLIRRPGDEELMVRLEACAICHSDIAYMSGAWGGTLPAVYGHEAAGVVEEVGGTVSGISVGDHVVVTLIRACGRCQRCTQGRPTLCEGLPAGGEDEVLSTLDGSPVHQGMRVGAFAELVTVHFSQVVVVAPDIPLDSASLLACGVLTGVGAVVNTAQVEPGSSVVVIGTGGVGLNCVQGAVLAGAEQVIAVDIVEAKLAVARAFGATHGFDASSGSAGDAVREATAGRGADYVFVAAGVASLVEEGAAMLRRGGTLVIVGMPPTGAIVSLDPVSIADGSLSILGSKMGNSRPQEDIAKLVGLYGSGRLKLDELISERFELAHINEAIDSARRGEQLRPVVVFGERRRVAR